MTGPRRIQRQRTRGWRMPAGAVYVGRPTKWGNPYKVGDGFLVFGTTKPGFEFQKFESAEDVVKTYKNLIAQGFHLEDLSELRGRDLACWCPLDQPCHADVLLELANAPEGAPCKFPGSARHDRN